MCRCVCVACRVSVLGVLCVCVSLSAQRPHSHTHASFACGPEIYHYQSRVLFITPRPRAPWFSVRVTERARSFRKPYFEIESPCAVCGVLYTYSAYTLLFVRHICVVRVAKISRTHPQTHRPYTTYIEVNKGERAAL